MRLVTDTIEFGTQRCPAVEHDQHLRLPHPRGRIHRRPGTGLHPGRWAGIRPLGDRARPGCRRLCPAAVVLLQRPQRFLRRDRQVPRCPAHLGARDARDLRRQKPALLADALPYPDGRRLPDRPAAGEQHRPRGSAGAGSRAGRDPVPAHQQHGRSPGAALRARRHDRPAHPAGHRRGVRRDQHGRPAGRLLLRRSADQPHRSSRPTIISAGSKKLGGVHPGH
jgi:hypothetical protein